MTNTLHEMGRYIFDHVKPNVIMMITLKQNYNHPNGIIPLTDDQVVRSATFLKDRIQRAIKRAYPDAGQSKIATFYHGRGRDRRKHLHMGLECSPCIPVERLQELMRTITASRTWIYQSGAGGRDITQEVKPVTSYDDDQGLYFIYYGLKEGPDCLVAEASDLT